MANDKQAKKFTKKQRDWLKRYKTATTFEPLMDAGDFDEIADASIQWFEDFTAEASTRISRNVPRNKGLYD